MKRGNARNLRTKQKKLLQLYSLWQETHREDLQRKWLSLLGEVLSIDPSFNLRREFQMAF